MAIEIPDDQEELQRDLLGKEWLLGHTIQNVNKFNMEMLNMSIITK